MKKAALKKKKPGAAPPKRASTRRPWSADDSRTSKSLAGKKPVGEIAKAVQRTVGATRQRATTEGISLRLKVGARANEPRARKG